MSARITGGPSLGNETTGHAGMTILDDFAQTVLNKLLDRCPIDLEDLVEQRTKDAVEHAARHRNFKLYAEELAAVSYAVAAAMVAEKHRVEEQRPPEVV